MKIAIHGRIGSFSDRWIEYCDKNAIPYKIVNVYKSDIIEQVQDCTAIMWHHNHSIFKDTLFSKQLLYSLKVSGKKVFPDFNTCWHFDDKVGQKYLLEAIEAPFVATYIFYSKNEAIRWLKETTFPKVFKLRSGAGSSNVKLLTKKGEAIRFAKKSFKGGFGSFNTCKSLAEAWQKFFKGQINFKGVLFRLYQSIIIPDNIKLFSKEKGYFYIQEFIKNNSYDIRVVVIGDKAFAIKRLIRNNDFRASGSGNIIYRKDEIDIRCVQIAFDVNKKIRSQCIAYDFIFDQIDNPLILEISYGFNASGYDKCEGYWDYELNWFEGRFNPYGWMVENLIQEANPNILI